MGTGGGPAAADGRATVAHTPGHTRDAAFDAELDFWIVLALPPQHQHLFIDTVGALSRPLHPPTHMVLDTSTITSLQTDDLQKAAHAIAVSIFKSQIDKQ